MAVSIETQRQQLARLYVAVIDADGIQTTHRLLSGALIGHRAKAKKILQPKREPVPTSKPRKPAVRSPGAELITWHGRGLALGPKMRRLTAKQQALVLAIADGLPIREAEKVAGYARYGANMSTSVQTAIAEERCREQ